MISRNLLAVGALLMAAVFVVGCADQGGALINPPAPGKVDVEREGPAFLAGQEAYDLGVLDGGLGKITVEVPYANVGTEDLHITRVRGGCVCYLGYEGDRVLEPGDAGLLKLNYDVQRIPAGPGQRKFIVNTSDPENAAVEMTMSYRVDRAPDAEQRRLILQEVRSLRREVTNLRAELRKGQAGAGKAQAQKGHAHRKPDTTVYKIDVGSSPILGSADAPVTIVEFVDMQCPYCVREYPKLQQIVRESKGKVRVVFKHFPLSFHKQAKYAHAALELAKREKGMAAFWKMHDQMIAAPKKLDTTTLRGYAEEAQLNLANFDTVMADEKRVAALLGADLAIAKSCGVRGTPTILVNGLKMTKRNLSDYRTRIKQILNPGAAKAQE